MRANRHCSVILLRMESSSSIVYGRKPASGVDPAPLLFTYLSRAAGAVRFTSAHKATAGTSWLPERSEMLQMLQLIELIKLIKQIKLIERIERIKRFRYRNVLRETGFCRKNAR